MTRTTLMAAAALALAGPALAQPAPAPALNLPIQPAPGQPAAPAPAGAPRVAPAAPGTVNVLPPGTPLSQPAPAPTGPAVVLPPGSAIPPGMVQTGTVPVAPQQRGNTRVGRLECDVSGSVSYVFGSTRELRCDFRPLNGATERYVGEIRRFGVDVGVTGRGTILWDVLNVGSDVQPGSLAGTYGGASSNISAGLGLGSAALIGGSRDQVALQPLALESSSGINVALGIAEITLRAQ